MTDALNEEQKDAILAQDPAGRLGAGGDVAAAVRLSGQRRGGLRHRPDPARQWRHGMI